MLEKNEFWRHVVLIFFLILIFAPFLEMINISFKDLHQFDHNPWGITLPLHIENYSITWGLIKVYIFNSIFYSLLIASGTVLLSAFSAYILSRFNFPGKEFFYYLIISLLMTPGILNLIPAFVLVKNLGLLNKRLGMILPLISGGQVFGIFLLRSFFSSLPEELFEAAKIDGAGPIKIFLFILIPLSKPILGTLAVINILGTWNNLLWPWVILSDEKLLPITVGLVLFQRGYYTVWGPLMAGYVISSLPLIITFAFASKLFIRGITSGALKI